MLCFALKDYVREWDSAT